MHIHQKLKKTIISQLCTEGNSSLWLSCSFFCENFLKKCYFKIIVGRGIGKISLFIYKVKTKFNDKNLVLS